MTMKRIMMLLVITTLLLVGCGIDSMPQEGLENTLWWEKELANIIVATNVKCDVHPAMITGRTQAHVSCQVDITEDASKLGFEKPTTVYLGGALGDEFMKEHNKPFSSSGTGVLGVFYSDNYSGAIPMVLTAELDGFSSPVEIVGVASTEGAKTLQIPSDEKRETSPLELITCDGTLIPNSSLAQVTFIGQLKDSQQIVGGGLLDTNVMPLEELCKGVSTEGVVFQIETTIVAAQGKGENALRTGMIRDTASGQPFIYSVVINHDYEEY